MAVTGMVLAGLAARAEAGADGTTRNATVEDVVKALEYDENSDLGRAMTDVSDSTSQWTETAFALLLKRTAALAPLGAGELTRLDRPAYRSLIAEPGRYRARAVRMTVRVHTVKKMAGHDLGTGDHVWPSDKPIWRLHCSDAALPVDAGPVVICSTVEPTGLGEPSSKTKDDEQDYEPDVLLYKRAPEVEIACVFYKVYRDKRHDTEAERDYPVAIAWHVAVESDGMLGLNPTDPRYVVGAVAIIGVCLAYYFIRRYTKRLGKPGPKIEYKPKRDEPFAEAEDTPDEGGQDEDQSVDPLLAAVAEEYERERQERNAEDHG